MKSSTGSRGIVRSGRATASFAFGARNATASLRSAGDQSARFVSSHERSVNASQDNFASTLARRAKPSSPRGGQSVMTGFFPERRQFFPRMRLRIRPRPRLRRRRRRPTRGNRTRTPTTRDAGGRSRRRPPRREGPGKGRRRRPPTARRGRANEARTNRSNHPAVVVPENPPPRGPPRVRGLWRVFFFLPRAAAVPASAPLKGSLRDAAPRTRAILARPLVTTPREDPSRPRRRRRTRSRSRRGGESPRRAPRRDSRNPPTRFVSSRFFSAPSAGKKTRRHGERTRRRVSRRTRRPRAARGSPRGANRRSRRPPRSRASP